MLGVLVASSSGVHAAQAVNLVTGPCSVDYTVPRGDTGLSIGGQVMPIPDADVDIVRATWMGTPSQLVVMFTMAGLKSQPTFEGRGVTAAFRMGQRTLRFGYLQNPTAGDATFVDVDGRRSAAAVGASYDVARSTVTLSVARSEIERFANVSVSSQYAQSLMANSFWVTVGGQQMYADTASAGDNVRLHIAGCDARPGALSYLGSTKLYYDDPARFAARLRDADGRPVSNAWLTFSQAERRLQRLKR